MTGEKLIKSWILGLLLGTIIGVTGCGRDTDASFRSSSGLGNLGNGDNSIEGMTLGEVHPLNFQGDTATISFGSTESDDLYLLILNSNNTETGTFNIQISTDLTTLPPTLSTSQALTESGSSDGEIHHSFMRELEEHYATSDLNPVTQGSMQGLRQIPQKGAVASFKVLSSLTTISSYETVEATLRYVGNDVLIYVDRNASDSATSLTDEDIEDLAYKFETLSIPLERNLFGRESDINSDGYITILMTPILNGFSSTGIVTGFFFPGDLYELATTNPASNEQEIFYTMTPDPEGQFGPKTSKEFVMGNILPGVLAHEYQHMISYNQHVLVNEGTVEMAWLNEGLSHWVEDIVGFGNENPSRLRLFLENINTTSIPTKGSPTLAERGGLYALIRYLYEQAADGDEFIRRLYTTPLTGTKNIEYAFDGIEEDFDEMEEFLSRWHVALALSNTGLTDDTRYQYAEREIDSATGNYKGVCIRCDSEDGRGTTLTGPVIATASSIPVVTTLSAGTARFLQLEEVPEELIVKGAVNSSLGGSIIRLKKD